MPSIYIFLLLQKYIFFKIRPFKEILSVQIMSKFFYFYLASLMFLNGKNYSLEINNFQNEQFDSILFYESTEISNSENIQEKLRALSSRAESYLLSGDMKKAIDDYEQGYSLMDNFDLSDEQRTYFLFRNRFGSMIAYFNEDKEKEGWECYKFLKGTLDQMPCTEYLPESKTRWSTFFAELTFKEDFEFLHVDKLIDGPDIISINDCVNLVNNTARFCHDLIAFVKKIEIQLTLSHLIDELANSARNCCLSGGLWKSCCGPILQKWSRWNQKWQVFRLPPDPAND